MPYDSSSEEDIQGASTTATRRGRRVPGRNLRGRRADLSADSSDDNDEGDSKNRPRTLGKSTTPQSSPPGDNNTATMDSSNPMSPLSQEAEDQSPSQSQPQGHLILEDPDPDTMRIMISTDNHLGYAETDNVRGNDSFAALEEVLYLAKEYSCDMVMLAGDLFHENRPSRRTLIKTSKITDTTDSAD